MLCATQMNEWHIPQKDTQIEERNEDRQIDRHREIERRKTDKRKSSR